MRLTTLVAVALPLSLLMACPPVEPGHPPIEPTELRDGRWAFEVIDADVIGDCEGASPRDIVGQRLVGELGLRSGGGARLALDGVVLRGDYDGHFLEVSGMLEGFVDHGEPGPDPDWDTEPDEDWDDDRDDDGTSSDDPAPLSEVPEPDSPPESDGARGSEIWLGAAALGATRLEGDLDVRYDLPGMRCIIETSIVGEWIGGAEPDDHPVVMEETVEDEPGTVTE